ncbi:Lipopolysaccharide kinase domain protein, partial [Spraguea lophii 42_110]
MPMSFELLAHGAEAKIYTDGINIYKQRISKAYRIPELDTQLIKKRTKSEKKILEKLKDLNVPQIINNGKENREDTICMSKIEGVTLKDILLHNDYKKYKTEILYNIGLLIRQMHDRNVIHGDITPLNIIIDKNILDIQEKDLEIKENRIMNEKDMDIDSIAIDSMNTSCNNTKLLDTKNVYIIDFGLSFISTKIEDKAVDLFVFEKSMSSFNESIEGFYKGYNNNTKDTDLMQRLEEVRS